MAGDDVFILNADDPIIGEYTDKYPVRCKTLTFSLDRQDTDAFVKNGSLFILSLIHI